MSRAKIALGLGILFFVLASQNPGSSRYLATVGWGLILLAAPVLALIDRAAARATVEPDVREFVGPTSLDDARVQLTDLRFEKAELQLQRRELGTRLTSESQAWRSRQAGRIPNLTRRRGLVSSVVSGTRRAQRQGHAQSVNGLTESKRAIEVSMIQIDREILAVQQYIAEQQG